MNERKTSLDGTAVGLLVACCLFWGFQQVLVKATLAEVPPVYQASIRFTAASVLIWLWCRQRSVALFGRDGTLGAGLLAGLLFAGEFACLYAGLHLTEMNHVFINAVNILPTIQLEAASGSIFVKYSPRTNYLLPA